MEWRHGEDAWWLGGCCCCGNAWWNEWLHEVEFWRLRMEIGSLEGCESEDSWWKDVRGTGFMVVRAVVLHVVEVPNEGVLRNEEDTRWFMEFVGWFIRWGSLGHGCIRVAFMVEGDALQVEAWLLELHGCLRCKTRRVEEGREAWTWSWGGERVRSVAVLSSPFSLSSTTITKSNLWSWHFSLDLIPCLHSILIETPQQIISLVRISLSIFTHFNRGGALPIAAAATKCRIIRSSRSASLASTSKCCNSKSPSVGNVVAFPCGLILKFCSLSTTSSNSWLIGSLRLISYEHMGHWKLLWHHSRIHWRWSSCLQLVTVAGSLSPKASRHMLETSSQASRIPPSTKAAAEVKCASDLLLSSLILFSSIPAPSMRWGSEFDGYGIDFDGYGRGLEVTRFDDGRKRGSCEAS